MTVHTVAILFVTLIALILLLIFMYKKLNREANGEYTIQRMVYKEGGVRDRMRSAVLTLETRLGIQLLPRSDVEGAEMESVEEGQVEDGSNQGSDTDGEDQEDEEDSIDQSNNTKEKSNDDSSLEGSDSGEQEQLIDEPEVKEGEKREEKQEKVEVDQGKVDASGGTGLLIDLKQFSGSAIWSEEERGEGMSGDVTAL